MDKNKKLPHLYRIDRESGYKGWALNATALFEDGPQLSQAITDGIEKTGLKKGEFIVKAVSEWKSGEMAQARNEHALALLPADLDTLKHENFSLWTEDDLIVLADGLLTQLQYVKKALVGWPTATLTTFIDEDSDEYRAWVEEQDNA